MFASFDPNLRWEMRPDLYKKFGFWLFSSNSKDEIVESNNSQRHLVEGKKIPNLVFLSTRRLPIFVGEKPIVNIIRWFYIFEAFIQLKIISYKYIFTLIHTPAFLYVQFQTSCRKSILLIETFFQKMRKREERKKGSKKDNGCIFILM